MKVIITKVRINTQPTIINNSLLIDGIVHGNFSWGIQPRLHTKGQYRSRLEQLYRGGSRNLEQRILFQTSKRAILGKHGRKCGGSCI